MFTLLSTSSSMVKCGNMSSVATSPLEVLPPIRSSGAST